MDSLDTFLLVLGALMIVAGLLGIIGRRIK